MPAADWYEVRWGRIKLWCATVSTDNSRSLVIHSPSQGDDHVLQDRGAVPRKTTCALLFDDMAASALEAKEMLLSFDAQVARGNQEVFVHPVHGAYYAAVENWTYDIDEDSNITSASCTFVKCGPAQTVRDAETGTSLGAGGDVVTARAEELDTALADVGLTSTLPATATAAIDAWSEATDVPTREVLAATAELRAGLEALIEDEGLEADLALWPAYVATVQLLAACRNAALAATAETPSLFRVRIAAPTSVLALCVRTYGGAEAEDRERQVRALNDLVTIGGLLQAGTELAMPARSTGLQV